MLNAEAFQDQGDKPVVEERGPYTFRWKKGGSQDFVTQAGGEKSQPGVARRPNRELPEEKVLLLREGDVRGSLGWYGMSPLYAVSELTQVISLNLPMVGAVDFAKGDFLKEYGISEMLSTFEVSSIFSRASKLIFSIITSHKYATTLTPFCTDQAVCEQDNRGADVWRIRGPGSADVLKLGIRRRGRAGRFLDGGRGEHTRPAKDSHG